MTMAFIGTLGLGEILLIALLIALLFFGKRIPEIARSTGRGLVEFKRGLLGKADDDDGTGKEKEGDRR